MPSETLLAAPLILAAVLLLGGIGKLGQPPAEALAALRELHVPGPLVRPVVARLHPWAEVLLAAGLLVLPAPARWVAAVGALGLVAAYTWLVAAALRRQEAVTCNCFGRSAEVVRRGTLARNLVLLATAVLAMADCALAGGAPLVRVFDGGVERIAWVGALAGTALLAWLIGRGGRGRPASVAASTGASAGDPSGAEDTGIVVRDPIPEVSLVGAGGEPTKVADLVTERAAVLLLLSPGCGPCDLFLEQVPSWRQVLHEISVVPVRVLPEGAEPEPGEPFPQQPGGYWATHDVAHALTGHATPSALLLGADGLVAGGPAVGGWDVRAFLGEIVEHLAGAA